MESALLLALLLLAVIGGALSNPEAKRLYEDLLSNYNRLIRPVGNNSDRLTVKMGLRLAQLIDVLANALVVLSCSTAEDGEIQVRILVGRRGEGGGFFPRQAKLVIVLGKIGWEGEGVESQSDILAAAAAGNARLDAGNYSGYYSFIDPPPEVGVSRLLDVFFSAFYRCYTLAEICYRLVLSCDRAEICYRLVLSCDRAEICYRLLLPCDGAKICYRLVLPCDRVEIFYRLVLSCDRAEICYRLVLSCDGGEICYRLVLPCDRAEICYILLLPCDGAKICYRLL
uniref:Neurotransmitter-gated ion-channel ligand-binding domain-containing protein n=1 Tax=Timema cristinae TaxID=61476 RepID=A0A7R9H1T9_TIMCR|nr:unnamed protein product [Timema cristinae]